MHIVAIHHLENAQNTHVQALAEVLKITAYEARPRVHIIGGGPAIVGVFAQFEQAQSLAQSLQNRDFSVCILDENEFEAGENNSFEVRGFFLEDQLRVKSRQGAQLLVPYTQIDLLLRGHSNVVRTEKTITKGKKFSMGRAVMTGGLVMKKSTTTVKKTTSQVSGGFLQVYTKEFPTLIFAEQELLYDGLGSQMKPSRVANFSYLVSELRRLNPRAMYDQRLMQRAAQKQMLGASLNPDTDLGIATALLAKILRS